MFIFSQGPLVFECFRTGILGYTRHVLLVNTQYVWILSWFQAFQTRSCDGASSHANMQKLFKPRIFWTRTWMTCWTASSKSMRQHRVPRATSRSCTKIDFMRFKLYREREKRERPGWESTNIHYHSLNLCTLLIPFFLYIEKYRTEEGGCRCMLLGNLRNLHFFAPSPTSDQRWPKAGACGTPLAVYLVCFATGCGSLRCSPTNLQDVQKTRVLVQFNRRKGARVRCWMTPIGEPASSCWKEHLESSREMPGRRNYLPHMISKTRLPIIVFLFQGHSCFDAALSYKIGESSTRGVFEPLRCVNFQWTNAAAIDIIFHEVRIWSLDHYTWALEMGMFGYQFPTTKIHSLISKIRFHCCKVQHFGIIL